MHQIPQRKWNMLAGKNTVVFVACPGKLLFWCWLMKAVFLAWNEYIKPYDLLLEGLSIFLKNDENWQPLENLSILTIVLQILYTKSKFHGLWFPFCQGNPSSILKHVFSNVLLRSNVLCSSNEPVPVRWTNVMVTLSKWPEFLVCHHMTNNYLQMKFKLIWLKFQYFGDNILGVSTSLFFHPIFHPFLLIQLNWNFLSDSLDFHYTGWFT